MFRLYPVKTTFVRTPLEGLDVEHAEILHRVNAMDTARFRLNVAYKEIKKTVTAGSALVLYWGHGARTDSFIGYVHSFRPSTDGYRRGTEIVAVSAAYPMFNESGRTFYQVGIHNIAQQIGDDYRFQVETDPHPHVHDQVLQKSESDWSLLARLGNQWGYVLMLDGVTLLFRPLDKVLEENYRMAIPAKTYSSFATRGAQILSFHETYSATDAVAVSRVSFKGVNPIDVEPISEIESADVGEKIFEEIDTGSPVTSNLEGEMRARAISAEKKFPFFASATFSAPYRRRPLDVFRIVHDERPQTWTVLSVKHIVDGRTYVGEMRLGSDGEDHSSRTGPVRMDISTLMERNRRAKRPRPTIITSRPYYVGTGASAVVNDQRWKAEVLTIPEEVA